MNNAVIFSFPFTAFILIPVARGKEEKGSGIHMGEYFGVGVEVHYIKVALNTCSKKSHSLKSLVCLKKPS